MSDGTAFECTHGVWVETCVDCDKATLESITRIAKAHMQARYDILSDKANSLARLVEQVAYAPVAGHYQAQGNDAPLRLLIRAVEAVDLETNKGGARG